MAENPLENLTAQEIKVLIENEIVNLQELDDSALEKLLDFEIEMLCHGSGDMDLMRQCSDILDSRSNSDKLNADEISEIIDKTKSEHITIVSADNNRLTVSPRRKPRYVLKRIAIIAAAILIMLTSTVAIASAFGVDALKYLKNIIGKPDGTTVNIDEFTFYNADIQKKYDSVQKMIEEENLDIMYPALLPEGYDIESITLEIVENGRNAVLIATNDAYVGITIELDASEFDPDYDEIYEHNGIVYNIRKFESYWANCYYKNNSYYITANTYEELIFIIDNMKE